MALNDMATNDALLSGLKQAADLIDAAQAILADQVRPDGLSAEEALFELLELLDNTIIVERQQQWRAAISRASERPRMPNLNTGKEWSAMDLQDL
jgi:hypothetical protein